MQSAIFRTENKTRDISLCAITKDRDALWAPRKVQWSSAPLLQFFCALHATTISLGSNAVKLKVWKVKNTLKSKYVIIFFEHLKSYFFAELNEDNFYMKIIDLDEIYNFLVLSFFIRSR